MKVTVTCVYRGEEKAAVPFPTDEVSILGDAKGFFILWRKDLVSATVLPPSV